MTELKQTPTLYIVIPCYNESEVIGETAARTLAILTGLVSDERVSANSRILFVDDGSRDDTWARIVALHAGDKRFRGLKLSRNRGHQIALLAGLIDGSGDADVTISMDADLQDDPGVIPEMLDKYGNGAEIVYGVRSERKLDSAFKRVTAEGYYAFLRGLGGDIVRNHADYRLLGRRALDALSEYKESNLFLRGIIPMLGYKSEVVYYARAERFAGITKYPLKKMLDFAMDGITSLSAKPLSLIGAIGAILLFAGLTSMCVSLAVGAAVAALICSMWACSGLILCAMGIVGMYIGKIYIETKRRPRYFIEAELDGE
ncbi:MAG: glycosyltransferase family 2 protein [Oscillospiraceae bacterium]|jgi:glycosyltransferase involved in cell wall biosynthesis|nr:glycosyltransferase family 2 protein [Oscillospiraceae bacterium]